MRRQNWVSLGPVPKFKTFESRKKILPVGGNLGAVPNDSERDLTILRIYRPRVDCWGRRTRPRDRFRKVACVLVL